MSLSSTPELSLELREGGKAPRSSPSPDPEPILEESGVITTEALNGKEDRFDELLLVHQNRIEIYLTLLAEKRILRPRDKEYLLQFLNEVVRESNGRADETESEEVQEAARIANSLLPRGLMLGDLMCVDGRVTETLKHGFTLGMPVAPIGTPGGDLKEVVPDLEGDSHLLPGSNFEEQLRAAFRGTRGTVATLLDSHAACAKRKRAERGVWNPTADNGLLADVKRKREIAQAIHRFTREYFPQRKAMTLQESFDPNKGYGLVGLETDEAIAFAEGEGGYTSDTLAALIAEGKILSTKALAQEFQLQFEREWGKFGNKPFDWANDYKNTALLFWKAIEALQAELLPIIKAKLNGGQGPYSHVEDEEEKHTRALLVLTNAFNGFCNNHEGEYPYGHHKESYVSVADHSHQPLPSHMSFGVNSTDLVNMSEDVVFSSGIVRDNRGKTIREEDHYPEMREYKGAPVAVVVNEVFTGTGMTEDKWDKVGQINWDFLRDVDWVSMNDTDFLNLLDQHNPTIAVGIPLARALNSLRRKMIALYDWHQPAAAQLMNGKLVALPVITDGSQRFRIIVPFFQRGFATH